MPVIGIRQLSRETASVIEQLLKSGEAVVITKQGSPVAALTAVDASQAQDLVLSLAPEIRESSSSTEVTISPNKTRSLDTVAAELAEEASQTEEGRAALEKHRSDLGRQRKEALSEVDRLFAEAPDQLAGVADSLVTAWTASVQALISGAVTAGLQSARALRQQVAAPRAASTVRRPRPGELQAVPGSTARAARKRPSGTKVARTASKAGKTTRTSSKG